MRVPYGKRLGLDGTLEDNPCEQALMALIREARAHGLSLQIIQECLQKAGLCGEQHQVAD